MNEIWFRNEAEEWTEAFPIGNGFMGAMVFGRTSVERIQVNEDSVWSGGYMERVNPDAKEHLHEVRQLLKEGRVQEAELLASRSMYASYPHMRHYQTLGDVWIDFFHTRGRQIVKKKENGTSFVEYEPPVFEGYRRRLNLEDAMGSIAYKTEKGSVKREFFASASAQVLVYKMYADADEVLDFEVSLTRKDNRSGRGSSFCDGTEALGDDAIRLYGKNGADNGIAFEMAVRIASKGGRRYRMGSHIIVEGAKEAVLFITGRTTYRSEDPAAWCMETLKAAGTQPYEKLKKQHLDDYHALYNSSVLELGKEEEFERLSTPERLARMRNGEEDVGLVNLHYNFARYLLISSSRENSLPANLQGIWNEDFEPAWGSKYTININIQMNYWMAEKTGLSRLHMPLLEHLKTMRPHGQETAEKMYGARGFCCHHNTDIWGDCAPQDSHVSATIWPMGGAWLCLHIIEHYLYTKDREFMEEFYGILRDSVQFFTDYMVQDEQGYWMTGPSSSPENIYMNEQGECGCLCMGPAMDSEILRELFGGYIRITEELGLEDELEKDVKIRLEGLPPIEVGKYGQIQEWRKDYEEMEIGHRHISQLFALYPAAQIRPDTTPGLARAALHTLERRLSHGGGHTGWSKAWIILFYARLRDGEKAWKNQRELLTGATLDNLFNTHPPFQIDGNFGGACGLLEMLVQDFEDIVFLLPALPQALKNGKVQGIRLKCGCILDLEWKDSQITEIRLLGLRDSAVIFADRTGQRQKIKFQKEQSMTFDFTELSEGGLDE